jgi:heptaprenylglyceryl phosphate synthase
MAGASAIVTGTLVEEEAQVEERIREIVDAISDKLISS